MNSRTAFAALGNGMQKQAYLQGLKDMGSGALEYAGNKVKSLGNTAATGIRSVGAGLGAGLTGGGLRGAADAMDSTYNAGMARANQQSASADAGWNKMRAGGVNAGQQLENFGTGASEYVGNTLNTPSTAGIGIRSVGAALGAGFSGGGLRGAADAKDEVWNSGMAQQAQRQGAANTGWNKMMNGGGQPAPAAPSTGAPSPAAPGMLATIGMPQPAAPAAPGGASAAGQIAAPVTAPPAAPTPGQLQQFQQGTASKFNPQSPLDKAKMQGLMGGQKTWSDNAWARGQMGKSAFAMLEKGAASGLAGGVVKGLKGLGGMLSRSGRAASQAAKQKALAKNVDASGQMSMNFNGPDPKTESLMAAFTGGRGRRRAGLKLRGAAEGLEGSAGAQKAINYGGGALAAGGALVGSNRLGHASGETEGRAKGVAEGFDNGTQVGMAAAQSAMPQDQGILGRIKQVFTGGEAPNMGLAQQKITGSRDSLIQSILAGRA